MMLPSVGRAVGALIAGLLGGLLFSIIGTPLPWTLGSLVGAAVLAVPLGAAWTLPSVFRDVARPVVGVVAGSAFTLALLRDAVGWWPVVLVALGYAGLISVAGYAWFRVVGKFDHATAFYSAMPAGLGELTLVGGAFGADVRKLVIVHVVRIVTIVVTIPFALQSMLGHPPGDDVAPAGTGGVLSTFDWATLGMCAVAGFLINKRLPIPAGPLLYPLLLSAVVHVTGLTSAVPPSWLVVVVQVLIGCVIGGRLAGISWSDAGGSLLAAMGWALILLVSIAIVGPFVSQMTGHSLPDLVLAIAPGGVVELTVVALAAGHDTAFVVTMQTLRILAVVTTASLIFGLVTRGRPNST